MISREAIQSLVDEVASKFDVERVILFGSYAYGTPTEDSDVDLLVLMEFEGRNRDQASKIERAVSHAFAKDILVRRPAAAREWYDHFDPIMRDAFDHGSTLYERRREGVAV